MNLQKKLNLTAKLIVAIVTTRDLFCSVNYIICYLDYKKALNSLTLVGRAQELSVYAVEIDSGTEN